MSFTTVPMVVLVGPTAVGKGEIAVPLAEAIDAEIIVADSQQVYRGCDIGTAKPTTAERERVPHHLLDLVEPNQQFDAYLYREHADRAVAEIVEHGKQPLVVGGSGFYIRAWLTGLAPSPPPDPARRRALKELGETLGWEVLHMRLRALDPPAASRIHPNDHVRLIRALEVYQLSGLPLSKWHETPAVRPAIRALQLGLQRDRAELYQRIDARIDRMMATGWLEEVRGLMARFGPAIPALRAVGYRELTRHLQGELTLPEAIALAKQNTRRFAKRQLTWFRADPEIKWFAMAEDVATLVKCLTEVTEEWKKSCREVSEKC